MSHINGEKSSNLFEKFLYSPKYSLSNSTTWTTLLLILFVCSVAFQITAAMSLFSFILLVLSIFIACRNKNLAISRIWVDYPVVLFSSLILILLALGCFYSPVSLHESVARFSKYSKFVLIPVLIFLFRVEGVKSLSLLIFNVSMSVILFLIYLKFYFHFSINPSAPSDVVVASHISQAILFSFFFYIMAVNAIYKPKKIIYTLLLLFTLWFMLFMNSGRTGLVILFFQSCYLLYRLYFRNKSLLIFILLSLNVFSVSLLVTHNPISEKIARVKNNITKYSDGSSHTSAGLRLEFYETTLRIIKHKSGFLHWIFGIGTGSFTSEYQNFFDQYQSQYHLSVATHNPHNQYLEILFEIGLLGLISLFALYASIWFFSGNSLSLSEYYSKGLAISLVVDSCLNSTLMDHGTGMFYVLFIAMFAVSKNRKTALENC